jgi:hypothetical protein
MGLPAGYLLRRQSLTQLRGSRARWDASATSFDERRLDTSSEAAALTSSDKGEPDVDVVARGVGVRTNLVRGFNQLLRVRAINAW